MEQIYSGKTCVLFAAGPAPWGRVDLPEGAVLIAVDGALPRMDELGLVPDCMVGDYDSLPASLAFRTEAFEKDHPDSFVRLPVEKDDTDTHFAARYCLERGCRDIRIYGALGGRLDHTIANLQTLLFLKRAGAGARLLSKDQEVFILEEESLTWTEEEDCIFAAFAMEGACEGVTIEGMQYTLTQGTLTDTWPVGCSNHIRKGREVTVKAGRGPLLCILTRGVKA